VTVTDIRGLSDEEIAGVYDAAAEDDRAECLAELERRDLAGRTRAAREALTVIRAEGEIAVHAQYLAASAACSGELLNGRGAQVVADDHDLWRMPERDALRLCSDELAEFWQFTSPRITVAAYVRGHAAAARAARIEARDAAGDLADGDLTTEEVSTDDGYPEHDGAGPGLARDEPGAFRRESPAAEAPETGAGGTVQRGGRGGAGQQDAAYLAAGTGRAGRPAQPPRGVSTMHAAFTTFDQIEPLPAEPLWPGYWPRGEVVGWFGDGGIGKGRAIIDLVARITRGDPMPFRAGRTEPGTVILVQPEDNPYEQIRPRLDAAGADVTRVIDMTRLPTGARLKLSAAATKDGDAGQLRECVETLRAQGRNPRLLVIDPVAATVGWGSIQTNAGARRLIEPLQDLAQSTGITVLLVMHTTKEGKLAGSVGIQQALRLLYRVSKDVNPLVRVISLEKANNLGETPDAKFMLEDTGTGVRVVWLDRAEQDRRNRSWRQPAPVPAPAREPVREPARQPARGTVRIPAVGPVMPLRRPWQQQDAGRPGGAAAGSKQDGGHVRLLRNINGTWR
jgi:hypothetical protein